MALGVVQGKSKYRHDTADDGMCRHEWCHRECLRGRSYCEAHEMEREGDERDQPVSLGRSNRVYFIGVSGEDVVKIGRTNNTDERLRTLQIGNHRELVLLAEIEAPTEVEPWVHSVLADCHIRGEWFKRTDKVNKIIEAAKSTDWDTFFQSFV